ncbi:hypothetical protein COC42_12175 [Sphingomonas spermidinifaciens]|uniref:YspA cpYpsA-related SLOG domain-containing protein n=1 Tax=Sphingomonas spermidinifaciens TaxID=1141889 RepID=A0A2A4B408_9SPHN|nr:DUF2493 domain-containing protein [Sphingomonas spermidinifaciens]PCD02800.1 hypothetical protein COC42_12175 [Sphingomonas spermidinifaciens]
MTDDNREEPKGSQFSELLQELELFGRRPFDDELDPRPLPEGRLVEGAAADSFDAMIACLGDTRLEPDLEDLLWGFTNVFHRAVERIERDLDGNELGQRRLQREQDGSEVKSVELETAIAEGRTMIERRDAMEAFREAFAEQFRHHLRKPWLPRNGSMLNRRAVTAAVIESREFVNDRRHADAKLLVPPGERIYLSGGADYPDHRKVWQLLDKIHGRHPQMVLLHGASRTGAEHISALWARERKVPQVPCPPDFSKHSRGSAPFKRNDQVIGLMPRGIIIFPGGGIQDNLFDKARSAGIPVIDHRRE